MFITGTSCGGGFIISHLNTVITRAPPSYLDVNAISEAGSVDGGGGGGALDNNNNTVLCLILCIGFQLSPLRP